MTRKRVPSAERDPNGVEQHTRGAKLDDGKLPVYKMVFSYFSRALRSVGWLSNTGARKYTYGGWSAVDNAEERYTEAIARHLFDLAEAREGLSQVDEYDLVYEDPRTGTKYFHHHLVSVAWNALAALQKAKERGLVTEYTETR
jgi:hypothetical protein